MRLPALIAAALLSAATACTPAAPPSDAPPSSDPPAAGQGGALDAAQRRWEAGRPAAYAYTLEISCFCLHRGRYALEVRNGQITSARDAATGAPPPADRVEWLVTVDRLFEAMREGAAAGKPLRATYHPQQGYPTEVEIGLLADDSGTLYRIENLRAL